MKKLFLIITLFTLHTHYSTSQWLQMPAFPVSGSAYSVAFINKDTGYVSMDTPALLRTTNGGQSWVVVGPYRVFNLQFTDSLNGFGSCKRTLGSYIIKTTDGGFSWDSVSIDPSNVYLYLFFVNKDTGWVSGGDGSFSKIWQTTNGGVTLQVQHSVTGGGYEKVFFLKNRINNEYYGWALNDPTLRRTTNSGLNWNIIYMRESQCGIIVDMYFKDTSNGVMTRGNNCFQTTSNGGVDWLIKSESNIGTLSKIGIAPDKITGWITKLDTVIKTNNFFQTHGLQDHSSFVPGEINVLDTNIAFTAKGFFSRTTNGGGNYVSVTQISSEVPEEYSLSQNYPNPFNPNTNIKYSVMPNVKGQMSKLLGQSYVKLIVYDMLGREVEVLVNEEQTAGTYEVRWDASKYPSGIYIYRIAIHSDKLITGSYTETKKAVLIK